LAASISGNRGNAVRKRTTFANAIFAWSAQARCFTEGN